MSAISNHLELHRNFENVCPSELQLKKENISTLEASPLDLSIIIENKKLKTQLYDERDGFLFSIVLMPHLDSNIPSDIYYASIGSEILKFARSTSDINTFLTLFSCLLRKMQQQESKHRPITYMLNKLFGKLSTVFNVFAEAATNFIKLFSLP